MVFIVLCQCCKPKGTLHWCGYPVHTCTSRGYVVSVLVSVSMCVPVSHNFFGSSLTQGFLHVLDGWQKASSSLRISKETIIPKFIAMMSAHLKV